MSCTCFVGHPGTTDDFKRFIRDLHDDFLVCLLYLLFRLLNSFSTTPGQPGTTGRCQITASLSCGRSQSVLKTLGPCWAHWESNVWQILMGGEKHAHKKCSGHFLHGFNSLMFHATLLPVQTEFHPHSELRLRGGSMSDVCLQSQQIL